MAAIARAVAPRARVLLLTDDPESVTSLARELGPSLSVIELATNDTWTRDYGPITVLRDGTPWLLDFGFNGWGLKFAANLDNQVTRQLADAGHFGSTPVVCPGLWLEGGSIDSDGAGTLLTTTTCLLSPNRNPHLTREQVEQALEQWLGSERVLWLEHGHLDGDDTDAHIDTLARLCPNDVIAYVHCDDEQDTHYPALTRMHEQLASFRNRSGEPFRLIPLPWPKARYATDGHRLPATYANYLVVNGAVLVPTYDDPPTDALALRAIASAYPDHEIIGIDCTVLIEQHGSLHCMTMHIPHEVFTT